MKKNIILAALSALLMMASCDKISTDEYNIFSGASGQWFDGTPVADHTQRAFLEKYTGPRCPNCPTADESIRAALDNYGERLVVVAIHDSSTFGKPLHNSPDMRSDDGDLWSHYFGVYAAGSYPAAMVNRTMNGNIYDVFTPTSGIESRVDNILGQSAQVAIDVQSTLENRNANIDVYLEFLQDVSEPLTLTLLIMEDGIIATQRQPDGTDDDNYVHNHILRDVITDAMGATVEADGHAGTKRRAQFSYSVNEAWNADNCHIVAFISTPSNNRILNVDECHLK